jgi:hypothetical protein
VAAGSVGFGDAPGLPVDLPPVRYDNGRAISAIARHPDRGRTTIRACVAGERSAGRRQTGRPERSGRSGEDLTRPEDDPLVSTSILSDRVVDRRSPPSDAASVAGGAGDAAGARIADGDRSLIRTVGDGERNDRRPPRPPGDATRGHDRMAVTGPVTKSGVDG